MERADSVGDGPGARQPAGRVGAGRAAAASPARRAGASRRPAQPRQHGAGLGALSPRRHRPRPDPPRASRGPRRRVAPRDEAAGAAGRGAVGPRDRDLAVHARRPRADARRAARQDRRRAAGSGEDAVRSRRWTSARCGPVSISGRGPWCCRSRPSGRTRTSRGCSRRWPCVPADRRPVLVLPGYPTWHEAELRQRAVALGISRDVRFEGWVDEALLEGLYAAARCFVFPSLYEGFGLPVLEAMRRGVAVACSDRSSLPEVAGDAALFFDPESPREIADALERLLTDDALVAELAAAGPFQAARFSWDATARGVLASYRRAAAGGSGSPSTPGRGSGSPPAPGRGSGSPPLPGPRRSSPRSLALRSLALLAPGPRASRVAPAPSPVRFAVALQNALQRRLERHAAPVALEPPRRPFPQLGPGVVDLLDRGREVVGRGAGGDHPVLALLDKLGRGVVRALDHHARRAAGGRLDHDEAIALAARRQHHAHGAGQRGIDLRRTDEAWQRDGSRQPVLVDEPADRIAVRSVAEDLRPQIRDPAAGLGESGNQLGDLFLGDVTAGEDDDRLDRGRARGWTRVARVLALQHGELAGQPLLAEASCVEAAEAEGALGYGDTCALDEPADVAGHRAQVLAPVGARPQLVPVDDEAIGPSPAPGGGRGEQREVRERGGVHRVVLRPRCAPDDAAPRRRTGAEARRCAGRRACTADRRRTPRRPAPRWGRQAAPRAATAAGSDRSPHVRRSPTPRQASGTTARRPRRCEGKGSRRRDTRARRGQGATRGAALLTAAFRPRTIRAAAAFAGARYHGLLRARRCSPPGLLRARPPFSAWPSAAVPPASAWLSFHLRTPKQVPRRLRPAGAADPGHGGPGSRFLRLR